MFQTPVSLPAPLDASAYTTEQAFQSDRRQLLGSWQLVASTDMLSDQGAYYSTEKLGVPIVVRNHDGRLIAFRNVCAHRSCQIVSDGSGKSDQIKCPFHGWQYGADGRTRKIPAAKNFPHHDRQSYRLETFRVCTVGQLVFVHLNQAPPDGRDSASQAPLDDWTEAFSHGTDASRWRRVLHREWEFPCDWKIPIEGSLESYHLAEVHPGTFGEGPDEAASDHLLRPSGTQFQTSKRDASPLAKWEERLIRMITGEFDRRYRHVHVFPNVMATFTGTISLIYQINPTACGHCRMSLIGFTPLATRASMMGRIMAWSIGRAASRLAQKVLCEDAEIFPLVQNGLRSAVSPRILGRCEERIHAFQSHWLSTLDETHPKESH